MLKTSMEFSKGILFIRLKGDLNKDTIKGIIDGFSYLDDIKSKKENSMLNKLFK